MHLFKVLLHKCVVMEAGCVLGLWGVFSLSFFYRGWVWLSGGWSLQSGAAANHHHQALHKSLVSSTIAATLFLLLPVFLILVPTPASKPALCPVSTHPSLITPCFLCLVRHTQIFTCVSLSQLLQPSTPLSSFSQDHKKYSLKTILIGQFNIQHITINYRPSS